MNTMTNVTSDDIASDMFQDLTKDDNLTEVLDEKDSVDIKQISDDSTEYSTDTFMFNTKDFEGLDSIKEDVMKTNIFIKILIAIVIICVIAGIAFIIFKLK